MGGGAKNRRNLYSIERLKCFQAVGESRLPSLWMGYKFELLLRLFKAPTLVPLLPLVRSISAASLSKCFPRKNEVRGLFLVFKVMFTYYEEGSTTVSAVHFHT